MTTKKQGTLKTKILLELVRVVGTTTAGTGLFTFSIY